MKAKKGKRRAKGAAKGRAAKSKGTDRLGEVIKLQQRSVGHWSKYAENAAKLVTRGSVSPAVWMKQYAALSKDIAADVSDLIRIVFPTGR